MRTSSAHPDFGDRAGALKGVSVIGKQNKKKPVFDRLFYWNFLGSGGWIRTNDLRVMSPTSYLTAPPRGKS